MFDVFYIGTKPDLFPHEQQVESIEQAQKQSRTRFFWIVSYLADYTGFNFLYEPVPWQSAFTHTWPSQHHEYSGTYLVPKTGEIKYHFHDKVIPNKYLPTTFHTPMDNVEFDYTWAPHPLDPPYIYVFGNQWWPAEKMPTVEYHASGATHRKYMDNPQATLIEQHNDHWRTLVDCKWDYSWCPDLGDPPYIYVFGNQWWSAEKMPTVEYHVPGATERKYMHWPQAELLPDNSKWKIPNTIDPASVNYSWVPDPGDPPYIYQFGTQHQRTGGPAYSVPGATEIKYVSALKINKISIDDCWTVPENINKDSFDWTWHPNENDPAYIYQFGTQWNRAGGPVYTVPGATNTKYATGQIAKMLPTDKNWTIPDSVDINSFDFSWTPDATETPYIYQFGTQHQRTGGPVYTAPGATEIKYIGEPRSIKFTTDAYWTVPEGADTTSFDWTWHPDVNDSAYIYQFGTQHQRTGGPIYAVPGATEVKYVEQIKIKVDSKSAVIVEIDHLDGNAKQIPNTVKTVRYFDNYRDTLIRIAKSLVGQYEFVWVCSSICDYSVFDFSWHPEQWQARMLHVFASNDQKFGDTFYMHVPTFAEYAERKALLEWYDVSFVDKIVPRRHMPVIEHAQDSNVEAIKSTEWIGPLALFTTNSLPMTIPAVNLWRSETKTITPLSPGASAVVVPRVAVPYIKTQLYDYSYIDKTQQKRHSDANLDIVFISNGEPNAEQNFKRLNLLPNAKANRLVRVDNINRRAAAYHAAARASTTPWFFAVFAKLQVDIDFDWTWQPDRMQQAKHYIFHALNPVTGLEYGHQAMIAYNKQLVLDNPGVGLDFTLDSPHEVVPILSGIAHYNTSPWSAWRTAFREALKLRASLPDIENEYRLSKWLDVNSDEADPQWSRLGAEDAVEYYDEVQGNFDALKLSYEWKWLSSYAFVKRGLAPDR